MIYSQRDTHWAKLPLGKGTGGSTIGAYGCYLTALADGLTDKGHNYDPATLSKLLLNNNLWDNNNYILVDQLPTKLPTIFTSFRSFEPWNDMVLLQSLLDQGCVIVCKVDAKGIGGSGTHFVRAIKISGANVIVHDPWYGDEIKVVSRYGKLGNILGLRVFGIKPVSSTPPPMPTNDDLTKILTHYNVKTADEFIASNDQQLKFLNEARVEVGVSQESLKKATNDHKNFVSTILGMVNSFGNPAGLSDEDLTIKDVATIRDSVSQLQGKLKEQQEIAEETSRKFAERERDLTNQISELERKASNLEGQVAELQNDIIKVKQNQQTQQLETAQNDQFKELIKGLNGLLKLFKRK